MKTRSKIVKLANSWLGKKESDGSHKEIIDIYNSHIPRARGYKLKYTDSWCAGTISALAIKLGYTDIIPLEVSCSKMIELAKSKGIWVEDDTYRPTEGDLILYDWEDSGLGENMGSPHHIGIVTEVKNNKIIVIEGNYNNAVKKRTIDINGRYIRGYIAPKYDVEEVQIGTPIVKEEVDTVNIEMPIIKKGAKGEEVKTLQRLLISMGYSCGSSGVDGDFGTKTNTAVQNYQKDKSLAVDGIVGLNTWTSLLK